MDPTGALLLIENDMIKGKLHAIDDADHHIYMDNPIDFVYKLVLDVYGEEEAKKYLERRSA